ncbi:MAG: hypothetical protein HYY86_03785 [Candidatus Harrisonbacteria bacterium]|nr:hypothetical protein [Candidatus Harrisonbacteria bacterium]
MGKEGKPSERNLRLKMLLEIKRDVTLLIFTANYNDDPTKIKLKKGTKVTLLDDNPSICATTERLATGPSVKIEETKGVEVEERFIGKEVTVPAQCLRIHPQEL